jgi:hypothetical protein
VIRLPGQAHSGERVRGICCADRHIQAERLRGLDPADRHARSTSGLTLSGSKGPTNGDTPGNKGPTIGLVLLVVGAGAFGPGGFLGGADDDEPVADA